MSVHASMPKQDIAFNATQSAETIKFIKFICLIVSTITQNGDIALGRPTSEFGFF